jgi:hypothetical protein
MISMIALLSMIALTIAEVRGQIADFKKLALQTVK